MKDFITTEKRSQIMRSIKSIDTSPELLLRRELWKRGFRYRKNVASLPGKPDIVFIKPKVAVFVDGEYWHGYEWETKKIKIKQNKEYWLQKIERNIARDSRCNKLLFEAGFSVLRFWTKEVTLNTHDCLNKISIAVKGKPLEEKHE